ncbi:MAG: SLC13 family permease [Rhodospirillales bacterium]|nr:SLC13 family permease [Rhodospirillales bacterium]
MTDAEFGVNFHMMAVFAIVAGALVVYALERAPMEVTSIGVVCALLMLFSVFPLVDEAGVNHLSPTRILQGFANPALITVLALLVMGQGMVSTGVLDRGARMILALGGKHAWLSVGLVLIVALAVSGFLNNIPVVVIFIPVMQVLAARFGRSVSKVMIPLSFAAVLGGMTTLVGSSTNLLVNSALIEVGERPFEFFDFTVPGLIMASVGFIYVYLAAPRLLPDRASLVERLLGSGGKQFIAQLTLTADSGLIGKSARGGIFQDLPDMTVRMVQRGEVAVLPPFEDVTLRHDDILVVAATRKALTDALAKDPGLLFPRLDNDDGHAPWDEGERMLAEAMIPPASRFIGQTLLQIGFHHQTQCIVLGVQRRSRMIRAQLTDIRLKAGDVLLIQGQTQDIEALKRNSDVVLIEWSAEELPVVIHARRALLIFGGAISLAAAGLIPIVVATLCGAIAMIATGVVNIRQATRAVDPKIATTIGAALAMGVCLQGTGGAAFLARALLIVVGDASTVTVLSFFFLLVAGLSNIISTKTCAVLFTPIAIDIAVELGTQPEPFAVAVVFAANCSFGSPIGYQTNLLVMGPGHYRFLDFTRVGIPLIFILWATFTLVVPWYYGL